MKTLEKDKKPAYKSDPIPAKLSVRWSVLLLLVGAVSQLADLTLVGECPALRHCEKKLCQL